MKTVEIDTTIRNRAGRRALSTLLWLEIMKLSTVRSGKAVLATMLAVGLVLSLGVCWVLRDRGEGELALSVVLMAFTLCAAIGAPLLGILIFTTDWQHREVLTMFVLEPRRARIFAAKVAASVCIGLALVVGFVLIGLAVSLGFAAGFGLNWVPGELGEVLGMLAVLAIVGSLSGSAMASAFLSGPVTIVVVILQVLLVDNLFLLLPDGIGAYLQSASLSNYLVGDGGLLNAITSGLLWIVLPYAVGYLRMTRSEPH